MEIVSAFEGLFETDAQDDAADSASDSNDGHSIPWDGEDFYDPNSFDMYDSPEPNDSPQRQQHERPESPINWVIKRMRSSLTTIA
jgi:hypothetical protein